MDATEGSAPSLEKVIKLQQSFQNSDPTKELSGPQNHLPSHDYNKSVNQYYNSSQLFEISKTSKALPQKYDSNKNKGL
jgi:hypothetical protein